MPTEVGRDSASFLMLYIKDDSMPTEVGKKARYKFKGFAKFLL